MPRDFLDEGLTKFASVTSVIIEASHLKEELLKAETNDDLKGILEKIKTQVEDLCKHADNIKTHFDRCDEISEKLNKSPENSNKSSINGDEADKKPAIKLVDINKLVDHNRAKVNNNNNVNTDDSVVIISSSDDEQKQESNKNKKATRKSNNTIKEAKTISLRPKKHKEVPRYKLSDTDSSDSDATVKNNTLSHRSNYVKKSASDSLKKKTASSSSSSLSDSDFSTSSKLSTSTAISKSAVNQKCNKKQRDGADSLEKLELLEINKLKDLKSLKRSRTRGKKVTFLGEDGDDKSDSSTSTTGDNHKAKKRPKNKDGDEQDRESLESEKENENNNEIGVSLEDESDKNLTQNEAETIVNNLSQESTTSEYFEALDVEAAVNTDDNAKTDKNKKKVEDNDKNRAESEKKCSNDEEKSNSDNDENSDKSEQNKKSEDGDSDKESDDKDNGNEKKGDNTWKKDKLLTGKLTSSDSDEEIVKPKKNPQKNLERTFRKKTKKRLRKNLIDSDSDNSTDQFQPSSSSSSSSSEDDQDSDNKKSSEKAKSSRKRVRRVKDSSEDDEDGKSTRKQIRGIIGRDSLAEATLKAEAEEKERKARIAEKQKKYNQIFESNVESAIIDKLVLDFDEEHNKELLKVDQRLVKHLKPHQASGVRFMWDACFESLERAKKTQGSGCILAHCMGLGKTLQVITLAHTLLTNYEKTGVKKVMVVAPLNTVLNWVSEFKMWIPENDDYEVYELVSSKQNNMRLYQVKTWHECGGVLIIGYEMFRNLSNPENKRLSKKMRMGFAEALVDPGPDLVICDEGHLLKNEKTNVSIAMNRLKTMRRIVLTGTPLQNNLKEYFCMVQFIKPNLLGNYREYLNRFVNPITNGQYTDSTPHDIHIMRKRSHVLHRMLDGVVQRRDYAVLQPYLPPKHEYVLFLNLTEVQVKLYEYYMKHYARQPTEGGRTSFLFVDFQNLQRICTHPRVLLDKSQEMKMKNAKDQTDEEESEGSLKDFIDDNEEDATSDSSSSEDKEVTNSDNEGTKSQRKRITRAVVASAKENGVDLLEIPNTTSQEKEWWQEICDGPELDVISHSSKLFLLFEILKECEQIGDKVLVFSQSLYSLNVIEYFLERVHEASESGSSIDGFTGCWIPGVDYFRLDGTSSCDLRSAQCKSFNDPNNTRSRLFLISTRAGGLGINLVAANRVIIFDVSWNPSHDVQSIYRVYRFGQTKPCYIYRFVTNGTMEMKIYERQVTKQAISKRVIDEQQIDRHYNQNDLQELYKFDPSVEGRPIPLVPKDVLLGEMLQKHENRIYKYHEHQSLLENKEEESLNEEERKAAWEEFENEKTQRNYLSNNLSGNQQVIAAITSLLRKENPHFTNEQVQQLCPQIYTQLLEQTAKGDLTLYKQIHQEMQLQKMQEHYMQQAFRSQMVNATHAQMPGTSQGYPYEVIDLND